MKQVINTGLPAVDAPLEWAVSADGIFYTAQIPIRADGSIETGDTIAQARQTFNMGTGLFPAHEHPRLTTLCKMLNPSCC